MMTATEIIRPDEIHLSDAQRIKMLENGYPPLPGAGKGVYLDNWPRVKVTPEFLELWSWEHPEWKNTGIQLGNIIAADNDIMDPELAAKVAVGIESALGVSEPTRIGSKGQAKLYRADAPMRTITVSGFVPGTSKASKAVEFLGLERQLMAFGIHPDTGKPYDWHGGSPLTTPASELPEVTRDKIMEAAMGVREILIAAGWTFVSVSEPGMEREKEEAHKANGGLVSRAMLRKMLSCINPGIGRKESNSWISVLGALKYAEACELVCDETFEPDPEFDAQVVAVEWSRGDYWKGGQPDNFDGEACVEKTFASLSPLAPNGARFGTIVTMARNGGYKGESRTDSMMDRFDLLPVEFGEELKAPRVAVKDGEGRYEAMARKFKATAYKWTDPAKIPSRKFLLGSHYIEGFVSATVAAPGVGKSAHHIAEAVSFATAKNILGNGYELHEGPQQVWLINLEDPIEELRARVAACVLDWNQNHADDKIDSALLETNLFLDGNDTEMVTAATTANGVTIAEPVMTKIEEQVVARGLKVIILDPFISSHAVNENDNNAVDAVVKRWARLAGKMRIGVMLVHHARKMQPGQKEITAESARGASSFSGAVRKVRLFAPMPKDTARQLGVSTRRKVFYGVLDGGKANLTPDSDNVHWFEKSTVHVGNGDRFGYVAVRPWTPPVVSFATTEDKIAVCDLVEAGTTCKGKPSKWLADVQGKERWIGYAIGKALNMPMDDESSMVRVKMLLKHFLTDGMLKEVREIDVAGQRKEKTFIDVGQRPASPDDEDFGDV